MDKKRRTYPSYLSKDEAARESRRTEEMVRAICGISQPRDNVRRKPVASLLVNNQLTNVGETNYFTVDYDDKDKLVAVYGKEIPKEYPFKLRLSMNETAAITRLLGKALAMMRNNPQSMRIGEKNSFVVDYDGSRKQVMLYQKEKMPLCHFKLAFDEYETIMIIHFLKKARNFFWK